MPDRTHQIAEPRPPALSIDDLDPVEAGELSAGDRVDYVRLSDSSLAGRDLDELVVQESEWSNVDLSETHLTSARFTDSRLTELSAANLHGHRMELRNCELLRSRLGFVDLAAASMSRLRIEGCKFGYLSLRGATIADAVFERCTIEEVDLTGATVERVAFPGSHLESITVATESAADLDLRTAEIGALKEVRSLHGVVIDERQLIQFAELFARQLGARVAAPRPDQG